MINTLNCLDEVLSNRPDNVHISITIEAELIDKYQFEKLSKIIDKEQVFIDEIEHTFMQFRELIKVHGKIIFCKDQPTEKGGTEQCVID